MSQNLHKLHPGSTLQFKSKFNQEKNKHIVPQKQHITYTKSSSETSTISPRPPTNLSQGFRHSPFSIESPIPIQTKKKPEQKERKNANTDPTTYPYMYFFYWFEETEEREALLPSPSYIPFIFCFSFNCFFSIVFTPMEDQNTAWKIKVKTLLTVGRVMKERRDRNGQLAGQFFWVTKMPQNPSAGPALDLGDSPALYSLQIRYFAVLRPRFLKRSLSLSLCATYIGVLPPLPLI